MRRLTSHVLSVLLVASSLLLGVYLFVFDRGATTSESEGRTHNVFPVFRRADLSSLSLSNGRDEFRLIQRSEGRGDLTYDLDSSQPGASVREPADMGVVAKLLSELELGVRERSLDLSAGPPDLHAMGLDAPRTYVDLSMGHIHYRLEVGAPAPSPSGAAYARLQGSPAPFVIRRDLVAVLEQPRDRYRIKTLVPYLASELSDWTINGMGPTRHLRRTAAGGLRIETEHGWVRVEKSAADRLVTSLADVRAETFLAPSEAEQVLGAPSDRLSLELAPREEGKPKVLVEVGGPCPEHSGLRLALRRSPEPRVAGCIPNSVWDTLALSAERLTDLHLFSIHPDEIEELRLRSGDQRLELARTGTSWHMRFPNDTTVEADTGNALARRLAEMVADGFASPGVTGSFVAKGDVSLTQVGGSAAGQDAGDAIHVVEVDDTNRGGSALVRRAEDGAILTLPKIVAKDLFPSPLAVRSPVVIDIPLARVRRVHVDLGGIRQTLTRSSTGEWALQEPKGFAPDPALANDIAEALGNLRADRWVAETADGSHGFETLQGRLEIEAESADGGVHAERIAVGSSVQGSRYARRESDPAVFVLPAAAERALTTWAIDRAAFLLDLKGAREVKIRRGNDRFTFRWPGEDGKTGERTLVVKDGERVNANANAKEADRILARQNERLAALHEALSGMLAEAAVHTGAARKDEGLEHPQLELWLERPAEPGHAKTVHLTVGTGDVFRGTSIYYVRREGINATFAVAQSHVKPLLGLP